MGAYRSSQERWDTSIQCSRQEVHGRLRASTVRELITATLLRRAKDKDHLESELFFVVVFFLGRGIESTWLIERQPGVGKMSHWDRPITNSTSSAGRDSLEDESWELELLQTYIRQPGILLHHKPKWSDQTI